MKLVYQTLGFVSLLLGTLGAFLPLLPTTCFVLLSAWCFARSSPLCYRWLTSNRLFGAIIVQWQQHRCIPNHIKWIAIVSMLVSAGFSILVIPQTSVQLILVLLVIVGVLGICNVKQCRV